MLPLFASWNNDLEVMIFLCMCLPVACPPGINVMWNPEISILCFHSFFNFMMFCSNVWTQL
uniref:Uncharacterized protein n=1 Tax=Rhizophora mucronata TaxID=61149 RepID=A0A2P2PUP3_RHIMU